MSGRPKTRQTIKEVPQRFLRPQRNQVLRRSRRRAFIRRGTGGIVALLVLVTVGGWAGGLGWNWLSSTPLLGITNVRIAGVRNADAARVRALLGTLRNKNLLGVDITSVRENLLADPWIEDVVVRRILPRTLSARFSERRPAAVAVLGSVPTLVDAAGQGIVAWSARLGPLDLPLITGIGDEAAEAQASEVRAGLAALRALRAHDPELMARLSEVDLGLPDRITARFTDDPAPVYLSREEVTTNLDHYMAVRDDIRQRVERARGIDLRWRGRVVVIPEEGTPEEVNLPRIWDSPERKERRHG